MHLILQMFDDLAIGQPIPGAKPLAPRHLYFFLNSEFVINAMLCRIETDEDQVQQPSPGTNQQAPAAPGVKPDQRAPEHTPAATADRHTMPAVSGFSLSSSAASNEVRFILVRSLQNI